MTHSDELRNRVRKAFEAIGVTASLDEPGGHGMPSSTPITCETLFTLTATTAEQTERSIADAQAAFTQWRSTPAPVRGALVARLGELISAHKHDLAELVTIEVGKTGSEALGEVQEMIDICEFAVGLSRQLYGLTIASERPGHRLMETWHPLGVVGVITAFNFPVAVWAWNTAVALVCGDTVLWKPSELAPLTALACQALLTRAAADVARRRRWALWCWVGPSWANNSSMTRASRCCPRRVRCAWASRWGPGSPGDSAGYCWNWAATTRSL